jgi:aspartyl-tRNA(Asn)/glutamyl-tRNA(Gln) amidotransferase subunit C
MSLTRADVEKVSLLARLRLTDDELARLTDELGQIVHFVEQLKALDTSGVAPLAHALDVTNVFADDEVRPSLARELALANAPKRDDECYRVPAVLGE